MPPRTGPDAKGSYIPHPDNVPLTAGLCIEQNWSLTVDCGPCRVIRVHDLANLAIKKPGADIKKMRFRCATCGTVGRAEIGVMTPPKLLIWTARPRA